MFVFKAVFLFCLVLGCHAQLDRYEETNGNYTLSVENFGNQIHISVLYKVEEGIKKYERVVDEEYKNQNLPFIGDLNLLFQIFKSGKDYEISD